MNRSWSFYQKIIDLVQLWMGLLPQTHQHLALKVPTSNRFSASPQVRHVLPPLRHRLQGLQVPAREGGVRRHEGGVPRQEGTCSEWTSWSLDSSHRPFLGEIEWGVIPKASAPSLWTVWTHWILSFVTYRLTYDWTNQFQTFWACCGMTRDCPQPKKIVFVDFVIGSVLMGSPVFSAADLCTHTVSLAFGGISRSSWHF